MAETPKPAIQSLTMQSITALAVALVASHFRVALPEGAAQTLASSLIDLVTTLSLIGAAVGRARATGPLG